MIRKLVREHLFTDARSGKFRWFIIKIGTLE